MKTIVEKLEDRIALATLVDASVVTYQDVDGDFVTVKFSRGIFADSTQANSVFTFSNGDSISGSNVIASQLESIDLSVLNNPDVQGVGITITAKKAAGGLGDGRVNVGEVISTGAFAYDLGKVKINGDLGTISAGDSVAGTPGVAALSVGSMGIYGTSTQQPGGSLISTLIGGAGSLSIAGDIRGAEIVAVGNLGSFSLGGSLLGDGSLFGGSLNISGDAGKVVIKGSILGGEGALSGYVAVTGTTAAFSVGGSIVGGSGNFSGSILLNSDVIGSVKVAGDMVGGSGENTGNLSVIGSARSLEVAGSLVGGDGLNSGKVTLGQGGGLLSIGKDVVGGSANFSGLIEVGSGAPLSSLAIKGSLMGGAGEGSGSVISPDAQIAKTIVGGNVVGGSGSESGLLGADFGASVTVGGSVVGGSGFSTGVIFDNGSAITPIASFSIMGEVRGGSGVGSGSVGSNGIVSLMLGKSLIGGDGATSGAIVGSLGLQKIVIGGDIIGGRGDSSGYVIGGGFGAPPVSVPVQEITVKGSLIGSTGSLSGTVLIGGSATVNKLSIGKDIIGGSVTGNGVTNTTGAVLVGDAFVVNASVGGSIIAGSLNGGGTLSTSGALTFAGGAGKVAIKGSLIGSNTNAVELSFGVLAAPTPTNYNAVNSLAIGGSVISSNILAGYASGPISGNVGMGKVQIGGSLIGSNVVAGIAAGPDGFFGTDDDTVIGNPTLVPRIASLLVKGIVAGSDDPTVQFGVVASQFQSVKIGQVSFPATVPLGFPLDRVTMPPLNGSVVLRTY